MQTMLNFTGSNSEHRKYISADDAAKVIGVSTATIRNWVKAGHIDPASARPLSFLAETISALRQKISSEDFSRLRSRANKASSATRFLPDEYSDNPKLAMRMLNIVECFKRENIDIEPVIFLAAMRLLEVCGEVRRANPRHSFNLDSYSDWARKSVKATILEWRHSLAACLEDSQYEKIYELLTPDESDDYLGLLYQSLLVEGDKSIQGSYYTPSRLVSESLSQFEGNVRTFLDPCCGTGKYLLLAAEFFNLNPEDLFGFDCDRVAINIAKINLLMKFRQMDFTPKLQCLDSLSKLATGDIFCETNYLLDKIDAIATNPPWGAYKNDSAKAHYCGKINSGETFSLFLQKSIQLLRKGGQLSFILPESILKIKIHSDIRSVILEETTIKRISILGRQFTGVYTPVIRLDLVKACPQTASLVSVEDNGRMTQIRQERFSNNTYFAFDISTDPDEAELLQKIYSVEHLTLAKHADWALGIVTGDNRRHVLDEPRGDAEAVYRGSEVMKYTLAEPRSFLRFTPSAFQQVAPERFFRAPEKLIYKFISKNLVFAYDNRQRLTLNSANILIPSIPGMSIKASLAFLNSMLFQYIFKKKFSTHKVLRGDLEKLPFPVIDHCKSKIIEGLVDEAIATQKTPWALEELIFGIFLLGEAEISVIRQNTEG